MRSILLIGFAAAAAFAAITPAHARDTSVRLDVSEVLDPSYSKDSLDGSVRFYFAGQPTPAVLSDFGKARTSRKTNAVGKSDAQACRWVMLTALAALQAEAKSRGANAVVDITSAHTFRSPTQFECHAGGIMAGVSLKGRYAKLADR
ncbi:MAG: excinuclease ATPase subunit [Arenimonas sp.]|jgi:hypothetical protein